MGEGGLWRQLRARTRRGLAAGKDDGTMMVFTERGRRGLSTFFLFLAVVVTAASLAAGGATVAAQDYYVGSAGDDWDTEPNCKNPANSTCSLRFAVFYAAQYSTQHGSPATVHVPEGEFFLSVVNPINLAGSVIIKGAGPDRTFIDGRGAARSFSIFEAPDPMRWDAEVHARIQDLTLRNGHTSSGGGAVRWTPRHPASTLELVNVVITDNHAGWGGGLWLAGGQVLIEDSVIEYNFAWRESNALGGGVYIDDSSGIRTDVTIRNTIIRNNEARSAESKGGGIWTQDAVEIRQSLIAGNVAGTDGGGAYIYGAYFNAGGLIVNSTFDGNMAGGYGAGAAPRASRGGCGLRAVGRLRHPLAEVGACRDGRAV